VDPGGAPSTYPRCGGKLVEYEHRVLRCGGCGFAGDGDVVATMNLYEKYVLKRSRCGVPGAAPSAPEPDEGPSEVRGTEVMR
jgi:transposase